ncbi:MAG: AMP-binding protein [Solirubrobacteraceae bacterium]
MATTVRERPIASSHARKDAAPATAEERSQPSYVSGASTQPLLGESIGATFDRTIERFGDREALVSRHQGLRYSYAELAAAVEEVARGLLAIGLDPGDRVGIWAPNCAEWTLVQFATAKLGIILVNINPAYRTSELEFVLRQSGCRALVAARAFKSSDYVAMVEDVRPKVPTLEQVVFLDGPDWDALLAGAARVSPAEVAERQAATQFDDPINLQYTSGTTGFPKGATLSHHNILNNAYFVGVGCGYGEADRICIPVPFYHCFGMVMGNLAAVAHGACMVIPGPAFDAVAVLEAVQEERCTSLYGVPTMFIAELEHPRFAEFDLSSLRTGIMAGSPCPVDTMRRVVSDMHMQEVTICYGMTETSPVSTQTAADDPLDKRVGTVGRVHPHVEIKVIDATTERVLPRGETGELCTRGYSVMLGYWDEDERTAEAIDRGRWIHTGDLAVMDDEGYLQIVGRSKDMVIRGGENVYPREIEEFLYAHPDIADVQVIGVPDARYGEEIMAWIVPRQGAALDEEAIAEFCRGRIAHFKIPHYVRTVDEFPMTVTGKVQTFKLRERAIEDLGLAEAAAIKTA